MKRSGWKPHQLIVWLRVHSPAFAMRQSIIMAKYSILSVAIGSALMASVASPSLSEVIDAAKLYADNCAECHQAERLGGTGPALIPQTLKRKKAKHLSKIISAGLEQTQMPAFGEDLSEAQIAALADYIKQPLGYVPKWDEADIMATREFNEASSINPRCSAISSGQHIFRP
ncbi:MAG TPA: hypothetical protein DCS30_18185 [Rhizobiales bacterium]|nr:hypothetical protein [Hyphomicrobiales bacterium]